jgi:DNA-binding NarL/FixJ family response regulator
LTPAESREILGRSVGDVDAATLIEECGGNPFYLEQLARSVDRAGATRPPANDAFRALDVPPAVAASLREEVGLLSFNGRVVLEGAAVAGDPFDPELTSAAARLAEAETIEGIDELLRADLVRTTEVPRRFRFRHPIVRRAAYAGTAPAWRMGAHERCAGALAARGASAAARAHHVERSARPGDAAALALLRAAGEEVVRLAPDSAATWFAAAIRLLPDVAPGRQRIDLLLEHAGALAAAGRFADSHEAMLTASTLASRESPMLQTRVATACASAERMLGRYEQAHRRLADALLGLPGDATSERAELLIELTLNEFYRSRYDAMRGWAAAAVEAASTMGEETLVAASVVMEAFADAMTGPTDRASASRARAAQLIDALPDAVLSERPDAAGWLAIGEVYLDRYADAEAHASRALALSRLSGRGDPLHRLYPVLPRVWYVRGKLAAAAELLDAAIETGRLLGSPPSLAGNLFNRSAVALAMGDLATARSTAEESVELTRNLDDGFVPAWAGARLAEVLHATGQSDQAIEILLERAGGPEVPLIRAGGRAPGLELLTRCCLASGRRAEAGEAAGRAASAAAKTGLPLAAAWANRAMAAVALETGDAMGAVDHALTSAAAAEAAGAPIEAALSRTLGGRALRAAGCPERAVVELMRAAEAFDACGARRYRDSAERELGALGHRPHRRTRRGTRDGGGIESLTQRELDVALLVVDRRTNREIASNLVLSEKTIETHLRNIFNKVGVDSRTDLARAIERSRDDPRQGGRPDTTLQAH